VRQLIAEGLVSAVHDVSDGGILVAVAEMALAGDIGARLETTAFENRVDNEKVRHAWSLFAENQGRYIVTERFDSETIEKRASDAGIACCFIGWTGGDTIAICKGEEAIYPEIALSELRIAHESFFKDWMEG
jgi:phosphoribosylformylglycinamidine synthase